MAVERPPPRLLPRCPSRCPSPPAAPSSALQPLRTSSTSTARRRRSASWPRPCARSGRASWLRRSAAWTWWPGAERGAASSAHAPRPRTPWGSSSNSSSTSPRRGRRSISAALRSVSECRGGGGGRCTPLEYSVPAPCPPPSCGLNAGASTLKHACLTPGQAASDDARRSGGSQRSRARCAAPDPDPAPARQGVCAGLKARLGKRCGGRRQRFRRFASAAAAAAVWRRARERAPLPLTHPARGRSSTSSGTEKAGTTWLAARMRPSTRAQSASSCVAPPPSLSHAQTPPPLPPPPPHHHSPLAAGWTRT